MITWNERRSVTTDLTYFSGVCLSTDTKPTGAYIASGSVLLEMDTSTMYLYDSENQTWRAWT